MQLPYVFSGHDPADTPRLLPLLQKLEQCVRLYYDDATSWDQIFPAEHALRLKGSHMALLFITQDSATGQHLPSVASFCISNDIPMLPVVLDTVTLSPGMQLRLSNRAFLFRDRYATDEDFIRALCRIQWIQDCLLPQE